MNLYDLISVKNNRQNLVHSIKILGHFIDRSWKAIILWLFPTLSFMDYTYALRIYRDKMTKITIKK